MTQLVLLLKATNLCRWIKEMEGTRLREVAANDPQYMRTMERAIRLGESVLLKVCSHSKRSNSYMLHSLCFGTYICFTS